MIFFLTGEYDSNCFKFYSIIASLYFKLINCFIICHFPLKRYLIIFVYVALEADQLNR